MKKEWTSATHSNKDTTSWSSKTSKLTWGDRWKQWLLGGCGCWLEEMPMRTPSRVTEMFSNFQWSHRGEPSCTYVCKSHAATKLRKRKNLWTKALKICQQLVLQPWDNKVNFIQLSLPLCCNIKKNFFKRNTLHRQKGIPKWFQLWLKIHNTVSRWCFTCA